MSKFSDFRRLAEEEAKADLKPKKEIKSLKDCGDPTKIFTYTLQKGVGEFVKEMAKDTPLRSASAILNDFIKEEFENYLEKKWNI